MISKLITWLLSPSKLPSSPPFWIIIIIFGVIYNTIYRHWWVAGGSLIVVLLIKIFNITPEKFNNFQNSIDKLIFPSMRNK
jgi:hypothetical protein